VFVSQRHVEQSFTDQHADSMSYIIPLLPKNAYCISISMQVLPYLRRCIINCMCIICILDQGYDLIHKII
jgi:hypothetical protein